MQTIQAGHSKQQNKQTSKQQNSSPPMTPLFNNKCAIANHFFTPPIISHLPTWFNNVLQIAKSLANKLGGNDWNPGISINVPILETLFVHCSHCLVDENKEAGETSMFLRPHDDDEEEMV